MQYQDLAQEAGGESSEAIKKRVDAARLVQQERFRRSKIYCNAQMPPRLLRRFCPLDPDSRRLLETAINKLGVSARTYNRILKIARTIADLAGMESLTSAHIAEAIQYRSLDRSLTQCPVRGIGQHRNWVLP